MTPDKTDTAARTHGILVPPSPFLTDTRIARINAGLYEREEIAGALDVVHAGDRVLELGAGLGIVGAVVAGNARPAAVLSFEANPELLPHIRALHRLNNLEAVMELRHAVLVAGPDRPDTLPFNLRTSFLGSSLIDTPARPTRAVDVPTADFHAVLEAFRPDVLIMDIEGGEHDLLAHARLDGIRAVVVEFHPGHYGKDGMQACKRRLRQAGFGKRTAPSSRLVWTCTRDPARTSAATPPTATRPAPTPPDPEGGWSHRIRTLQDACIQAPFTDRKATPSGVIDRNGADVPEAASWNGRRRMTEPFPPPAAIAEEIPGTWLWGGTLWSYFAHFIVESPGRLWALDHLDTAPDGLLYIPRRASQGTMPNPVRAAFFAALGVELPLRIVTETARVERLVVPGQGFGLGAISAGTPAFRDFIHARFGRDVAPDGPDKLYISRSRLGRNRGKLLGEARIEEALAAQGYEIFHPQEHDLRSQIARYKAAERIVAPEGSALHIFAFVGGPHQRVALIPRRRSRATRNIIRHLESFTGAPPAVFNVLTEVWQPTSTQRKRLSAGEPDLPRLHAGLADAGFIAPGPAWAPLDAEEIRKDLRRDDVATGETLLE